jgi:hypothetical protein
MRPLDWLPYCQAWCVDFEFGAPPGERPSPICMVARELRTGRLAHRFHEPYHLRWIPGSPQNLV